MSDRGDLGAGIYAGLMALVMLVAFLGAFFLPSSFSASKWLGIFALAGYFIVAPLLLRLAHRDRIRDAVEKMGGRLLNIKKLPFWRQSYPRYAFFLGVQYRVDYLAEDGLKHRAICNSGFFQGVEWQHDMVS